MKRIIPALLLSIMFFQAASAQEDEGIGGVSPKKIKYKPLQTGRAIIETQPKALEGKAYGLKVDSDTPIKAKSGCWGGTRIFIRCGSTRFVKPLYVIDDVPFFNDPDWNSFDVNSIISIEIIKGDKAGAIYGNAGAAGVILIYTKQKTYRVRIKDSLRNRPLPYATVELLYNDNRKNKVIVADSAGYCLIDKRMLANGAVLRASYAGYIPGSAKSRNISFEKDSVIRLLPATPVQFTREAKIFPNPVNKGNTLQVKFTPADAGQLNIVLSSIQGLPVYQASISVGKEQCLFSIQIPRNIPAGIYLLTANNTTGQLVVQQRIVVE